MLNNNKDKWKSIVHYHNVEVSKATILNGRASVVHKDF